jgi:hypothetical protein
MSTLRLRVYVSPMASLEEISKDVTELATAFNFGVEFQFKRREYCCYPGCPPELLAKGVRADDYLRASVSDHPVIQEGDKCGMHIDKYRRKIPTPCKRYLLFTWPDNTSAPLAGWSSFHDSYNSVTEAIKGYGEQTYDNAHVVDTATGTVIWDR